MLTKLKMNPALATMAGGMLAATMLMSAPARADDCGTVIPLSSIAPGNTFKCGDKTYFGFGNPDFGTGNTGTAVFSFSGVDHFLKLTFNTPLTDDIYKFTYNVTVDPPETIVGFASDVTGVNPTLVTETHGLVGGGAPTYSVSASLDVPLNSNVDSWTLTLRQTPGPLPILGVGAAFGFSRKLRNRIKAAC